ncbi:DUF3021 family protein [Solibacillus silvestris]|uniref:DUF3021 family protein n=1 Tax=Solibacillus silvestris TaxID=76853 RepID=UPI003F7FC387
MRNAISSTFLSFAIGCMIFMLSLCIQFWKQGEEVFNSIDQQYDMIVFGIFIVGVVAGGLGSYIYASKFPKKIKLFLHYGTTIISIMVVSVWVRIVDMSWNALLTYFILTTAIFIVILFANYYILVNDAKKINSALAARKK